MKKHSTSGGTALSPSPEIPPAVIRRAERWYASIADKLATLDPVTGKPIVEPLARLVLECLRVHVSNAIGTCYPGRTLIARALGCNEGSVNRSLNQLAAVGVIEIKVNPNEGLPYPLYPPRVKRAFLLVGYAETWQDAEHEGEEYEQDTVALDRRATRTLNSDSELGTPTPTPIQSTPPTPNKNFTPSRGERVVESPARSAARSAKKSYEGMSAQEKALVDTLTKPTPKEGKPLSIQQAMDLIAVARGQRKPSNPDWPSPKLSEEAVKHTLRNVAFILNGTKVHTSTFRWVEKAICYHDGYHRGPDEAQVVAEACKQAARPRTSSAGGDPPPTRSELGQLAEYYRDVGESKRALAVQHILNGDAEVTPNLMAMVVRLRNDDLEHEGVAA